MDLAQRTLFERVLVWGQDSERGRQSSMTTLLAEVSERGQPKPSREEADRLKRDVCHRSPTLCLPALEHVSLVFAVCGTYAVEQHTERMPPLVHSSSIIGDCPPPRGRSGLHVFCSMTAGPARHSPLTSPGCTERHAEGGGAEAAGEEPGDGGGDVPPAAALERRPLALPAQSVPTRSCSRAWCTLGLLRRRLQGPVLRCVPSKSDCLWSTPAEPASLVCAAGQQVDVAIRARIKDKTVL